MSSFIYDTKSPAGKLTVTSGGGFITKVAFGAEPRDALGNGGADEAIRQCVKELDEYFAGRLTQFTVPLKISGTAFQTRVWEELRRIPYGTTVSYKQLAERAGNAKAVRAVGGANHRNPVVVIIPCHRVIGSDGSLTGFGGGLEAKEYLLELERSNFSMRSVR